MKHASQLSVRMTIVMVLSLLACTARAAAPESAASASIIAATSAATPATSVATAQTALTRLQVEQDHIRQATSTATNISQLNDLDSEAGQLDTEIDSVSAPLSEQLAQIQAQLDVLGPAPAPGAPRETVAVAQQRASLSASKAQLATAIKQAADEKASLASLTQQFGKLRHNMLSDLLALRSGSILGLEFWAPLYQLAPDDSQRLHALGAQIGAALDTALSPASRVVSVLLWGLALAVWIVGRKFLERGLSWLTLTKLPPTRLRRSMLAFTTVLATMLTASITLHLGLFALLRGATMTPELQMLNHGFIKIAMTCAMIVAVGRALLCIEHPSWRLPGLADPIAQAISPFVTILATFQLIAGAVEQLNHAAGVGLPVTLLGRGVVALAVVLTVGGALWKANRIRAAMADAGDAPEDGSAVAGVLYSGVTLAVVVAFLALLAGYVTFARFTTYEMVWCEIVLGNVYILMKLTSDLVDLMFASQNRSGAVIKQLFGVQDRHLKQASTALTGLGTSVLLLLALVALITGGFGSTPDDLLNGLLGVLGGDKLRQWNTVPDRILNSLIALGAGLYILRAVKRWLEVEFLPTLRMDPGMRASLLMLFSNVGYVVLVLVTLSLLGVRWESLAWIVSALSVGIGFGLQEIVKNFISGLILLTERPVKVGDLVSLSGVEGDILRINVRATEILLGDRSTVIVPNSQLISQNVRNVTMNNSTLGVATLSLTFPLKTDPEQVRDLLLGAFHDHEGILDKPAPSVTFADLTPTGMTLSVTGYVASPRVAGGVKSDLLFAILRRLREAGIALSSPQALTLQSVNQGEPAH
jgi:potassium-dependent mechanosensitive channel